MDKIRVLLIEDDADWKKIIEILLCNEKDMILVGYATTKEEAIRLASTLQIDVFLIDINLTDNNLDGIYTALELKESGRDWKMIMLTSMNEEEVIQKSFVAGASNYVLKKSVSEIPNMIRKIHYDQSPLEALVKDYCRLKQEEQLKELTPAEREIYELVEQGLTRSEMEKKLIKTESTIKNQIKNILRKLSVSNTKEAVKKAKSGGLI
ncbi:response regulator [Paenibacillus zanthoxyli]|uniref:response regulator n=1 Tax=Paenibacillus zanthoxyli TaxID=369399 RepID=UPI000470D89C|nr:response regulator transcription factor [Paenibacillus zanthoxyli]